MHFVYVYSAQLNCDSWLRKGVTLPFAPLIGPLCTRPGSCDPL